MIFGQTDGLGLGLSFGRKTGGNPLCRVLVCDLFGLTTSRFAAQSVAIPLRQPRPLLSAGIRRLSWFLLWFIVTATQRCNNLPGLPKDNSLNGHRQCQHCIYHFIKLNFTNGHSLVFSGQLLAFEWVQLAPDLQINRLPPIYLDKLWQTDIRRMFNCCVLFSVCACVPCTDKYGYPCSAWRHDWDVQILLPE